MRADEFKRWAINGVLRWNKPYQIVKRRLDEVCAENERLRLRVDAANQSNAEALRRADELRKEKERLRERLRDLKLELKEQARSSGLMSEKMTRLRDELERLDPADT